MLHRTQLTLVVVGLAACGGEPANDSSSHPPPRTVEATLADDQAPAAESADRPRERFERLRIAVEPSEPPAPRGVDPATWPPAHAAPLPDIERAFRNVDQSPNRDL